MSAQDGSAGPEMRTVDEHTMEIEMKEARCVRWGHAVHACAANTLFKHVQFVNREDVTMFGSDIQVVVCKECRIPENDQLEFWTNVGSDKVEEVLRRKRQTVMTSFRCQFESEQAGDACVIAELTQRANCCIPS
jgi:hypothetical protein